MRSCRPFLSAALAGVLVTTAAACGADDDDAGSVTAAETPATVDGGWSYTDGSGETVTLDEIPERVVMHASSAAALIALGIRPVGIYADGPVGDDLALSSLDLDGIEIVGEEWGVINVEAVAA